VGLVEVNMGSGATRGIARAVRVEKSDSDPPPTVKSNTTAAEAAVAHESKVLTDLARLGGHLLRCFVSPKDEMERS
jgi:hypothetical protein